MTKQPPGIKKMPNGNYRARYFAGYDGKGKRVYPQATFPTLSDARTWLDEERTSRSGTASGHGWTVGAWLDHWLKTHHGIRDSSRDNYRSVIDTNIKPYLGKVKLQRLNGVQQRAAAGSGQILRQKRAKRRIVGPGSRANS